MLAGRDLLAGGTWLGVDPRGRFAAVTNFHEPGPSDPTRPTRGALVADYLRGGLDATGYVAELARVADRYAGFSLVIADADSLWYASNRRPGFARSLPAGVYGLSNHLLDTPWPKTVRARAALADWVDTGSADTSPLRTLLHDPEPGVDASLSWPAVSGPFVRGTEFGTRSSTWLARDAWTWRVDEENFTRAGESAGVTRFSLPLV